MPSKYRSKKSFTRVENERDTYLVVIAVEGARAEPIYFGQFHSTRVRIEVIPPVDNGTSPAQVLDNMRTYISKNELKEDDEKWLVCDVDRWTAQEITGILPDARNLGVGVAISNPCFEVWLTLHHQDDLSHIGTCQEAKAYLGSLQLGYSNQSCIKHTRQQIDAAINRAEALASCIPILPEAPGTGVHRLVRQILKLQ